MRNMNPIALSAGDIIQIGKGQKQVVLKAYMHISPSWDGDYSVFQIETLPYNAFSETLSGIHTSVNPKSRFYYLDGYSMHGKGRPISMSDVKRFGRCNLTTRIETTYGITQIENF